MQKKIYLLSAFLLLSFFQLVAQTSLSLPTQNVVCGQQVQVPITVTDFTDIVGLQFSLQWNPSNLNYESTTTINEMGAAQLNELNTAGGTLGFTWFDVRTPITRMDGDSIIFLNFTVIGNNFTTADITFISNPTQIAATQDVNGQLVEISALDVSNRGQLTLVDTTTPTITCPAPRAATTVSGSTEVAVTNLTPIPSDNCGIATTTYVLSGATTGTGDTDASGQLFSIGVTTITYTTTDFAGNSTSCEVDVTVTAGTVGPNDNLIVRPGSLIDQCGGSVNIPVSVVGFDEITDLGFTFNFDAAQFTYVGIADFDLDGLDISNFDVSQSAAGTIAVTWDNDIAQTKVDDAVLFNVELSSTAAVTNSPLSISSLTAQQNNITYQTTAGTGTVTLQDNTSPVITCPANQTTSALAGSLNTVVNNIGATATDNCGDVTFTYAMTGATTGGGSGDASGTAFNIGVTTITYTAADESGNTTNCSFTVTVSGESPTDFTLIAQSTTASCDADDISIAINVAAFDTIAGVQFSVNWDPAALTYVSRDDGVFTAADNAQYGENDLAAGKISYTWFDFNGQTLPDGSTLFTLHFEPVGGGTSTVNFTSDPVLIEVTEAKDGLPTKPMSEIILTAGSVQVTDSENPTIGCPADQTITLAMGETTTIVNDLDAIATDNCGFATVTYELTGATVGSGMDSASGQTFNIGTTTVTYTATDGAGNTSTCSSTVTVDSPGAMAVNVVNANAVCGAEPFKVDITVDNFINGVGIQFSVNWGTAVLQYDSINFTQGLAGIVASDFQLNDTGNGNLGFAWFDGNFSPQDLADGTVLFSIYYSVLGTDGANTTIEITDNPVLREGSVLAGGAPMGVPLIGNSSQINIVDDTPPLVTSSLPASITLYVAADGCTAVGAWTAPTFMDECSNNLSVTRSIEPGALLSLGDTTLTYTATDPSGNSVSNSTTIMVRDTIAPVIMNCPTDFTVTADATTCQAVANWTAPTGDDNCDFMVISSTHNPGVVLTETTVITYTAEDAAGNRSTCSFTVTVEGVTPIVFESFPGNLMVNAAQGQCGANIGWTAPTATGGCNANSNGTIAVVGSATPGDFFPVGVNTVVYTATDEAGVSISNSFTVTVIDNQELTAICPTDIEIQADGTVLMDEGNFINTITSDSCGRYVITYNDIMAFDNCSPVTPNQTQGPTSGSQFTFGTTMMEFVLSDTLGNSRTCTFQITINETNDLAATTLDDPTCAGADLRLSVNTLMGGSYQWTGPGGFLANVQNPVIPNAMTQNSGEYVVKVISENGCTIKDSIMVGILSAPEITASGNDLSCTVGLGTDTIRLFAEVTNGIPIQTYQWTGPGGFSTDFQNPIIPDATTTAVGQYTVVAESSNGCTDTEIVVIGLGGMVMPTLTTDVDPASDTVCANSPITLTGTAYDGLVTYTWIAPDDAGLPADRDTNVIVATPTVPGTYTYGFTANLDGNCTSDTARVTFVVVDGTGAITLGSNGPFDCAAANQTIDLTAAGGTDIATYAWTGPNGFTSSEQNPSIPADNAASGTYTLVATSTSGCTSTNTIDIAVSFQGTAPDVIITNGAGAVSGLNACEGDALTFTGQDIPNATYEWVGPNEFTSDQRVVTFSNIMAENAGAYQLKTIIDGCASAPRTVGPINVLDEPVANSDDFTAVKGQSTTVNLIENDVLIPGAPFTITVMSGTTNGTLTNNNDGTFTYTPNDGFGGKDELAYEICYTDCPDLCDMATITLDVGFDDQVCIVPTFISPNGDGFNDFLVISCIVGEPKAGSELIVFNEWGSEVYRQERYNNDWAGTYNGEDLPDGTYYYIYKADNDDPDPKKGYVTIFR